MRHGIAEDHSPEGDDAARKLTERGRDKIRKAALGMHAIGLSFDRVVTSPLARAAETAEIVTRETGAPAPHSIRELATGTTPAAALSALRKLGRQQNLLVVGHEPTLSRLAALLIAGSTEVAAIRLKQGGVIALEFDDALDVGSATLCWMMTQRQLRKLKK
jgi:phosphohistidine phosphatase